MKTRATEAPSLLQFAFFSASNVFSSSAVRAVAISRCSSMILLLKLANSQRLATVSR